MSSVRKTATPWQRRNQEPRLYTILNSSRDLILDKQLFFEALSQTSPTTPETPPLEEASKALCSLRLLNNKVPSHNSTVVLLSFHHGSPPCRDIPAIHLGLGIQGWKVMFRIFNGKKIIFKQPDWCINKLALGLQKKILRLRGFC